MKYKISNQSLRSWFDTLSDEEKVEFLGGYLEKVSNLEELIAERTSLISARNKLMESFDEDILSLTQEIETLCQHDYDEPRLLFNDDDGYSRRKITYTYEHICKVCGKRETYEKVS